MTVTAGFCYTLTVLLLNMSLLHSTYRIFEWELRVSYHYE